MFIVHASVPQTIASGKSQRAWESERANKLDLPKIIFQNKIDSFSTEFWMELVCALCIGWYMSIVVSGTRLLRFRFRWINMKWHVEVAKPIEKCAFFPRYKRVELLVLSLCADILLFAPSLPIPSPPSFSLLFFAFFLNLLFYSLLHAVYVNLLSSFTQVSMLHVRNACNTIELMWKLWGIEIKTHIQTNQAINVKCMWKIVSHMTILIIFQLFLNL